MPCVHWEREREIEIIYICICVTDSLNWNTNERAIISGGGGRRETAVDLEWNDEWIHGTRQGERNWENIPHKMGTPVKFHLLTFYSCHSHCMKYKRLLVFRDVGILWVGDNNKKETRISPLFCHWGKQNIEEV